MTNDDVVNENDRDAWLADHGTVVGDFDLKGKVDSTALNAFGAGWRVVSYANGDADGDGRVGPKDLNRLGIHWQYAVCVGRA